jgi:hypothetical protein
MDPLSALSLAGNIIQFVDFGVKLLSGAVRLYRSPTGTLPINDEIELITTDLKALIIKLRGSSYFTILPDQDDEHQRLSFSKTCDGAIQVAEEVFERLNKVKAHSRKHRKVLSSIQQAVKSCWEAEEIKNLLKRLKEYKEVIETRVLFSLKSVFYYR